MDEERSTNQEEEMNEENDAREEDIVEDTDSDTQDVEETTHEDFDKTEARFSSIEATLDKILGQISSLREAQGIMVENGAVINDVETDIGDLTDAFVAPKELDLLI